MRNAYYIIDLFLQAFLLLITPVLLISIFLSIFSIPSMFLLVIVQLVSSVIRATSPDIKDRVYMFMIYWIAFAAGITYVIIGMNIDQDNSLINSISTLYMLSALYFLLSIIDTLLNRGSENIRKYYNSKSIYRHKQFTF